MRLRELIERIERIEQILERLIDRLEGEHDTGNVPSKIVLRPGVPHNN